MNSDDAGTPLTPEQLSRLKEAVGRWLASESGLRAAVLDTVDAGGTIADVAKVSGLRVETLEQWTGLRSTQPSTEPAPDADEEPAEVDEVARRRRLHHGSWKDRATAAEEIRADADERRDPRR